LAGDEVIGAISLGYGEPPKDSEGLREIADLYRLGLDQLMAEAHAHHSCPQTLIQIVKKSLAAAARIMGALVVTQQEVEARIKISQHPIPESKGTEKELRKNEEKNRQLVGSAPTGSDETEGGRLTDYIDFSNAKSLIANDVTCQHNGGFPEKILALNPMESAARGFWTDFIFK
jgi:Rieske Fe-S protein